MKKIFLLPALCFSVTIFAQDLEKKVPEDATIVARANGENLLDLMSVTELDESILGKSLLGMVQEQGSSEKPSLTDFGFNIDASSYYYMSMNDSVFYNTLMIPIADDAKMEKFFTKIMGKEIVQEQEFHTFEGTPDAPVMVWDKKTLVLVYPSLADAYFKEPAVMERYGLTEEKTFDFSNWGVEDDSEDEMYYEDETGEEYTIQQNGDTIKVETPEEVEIPQEIPSGPSNYEIKNQLGSAWAFDMAKTVLRTNPSSDITKNKAYRKNVDDDAVLSLFVGNYDIFMESVLKNAGSYSTMMGMMNFGNLYKDAASTTNLFLNEDEIVFESISNVSDEIGDVYKKVFDRKVNNDFVNYINEDKSIAFFSFAINTEEALTEYPKLMQNIYKDFPTYGQEMDLGLEAFSLLLDEKAVGNVIKGDFMFLLNDFTEQERTFTTYDYDEDFNYVEKEETKKETLPDFLLMFSSDDTNLLSKLVNYGTEKGIVNQTESYYEIMIPESPMSIYFAIREGIIFLGTSASDMKAITSGTFVAKLSKEHEKLILKNKFSGFFNPKVLADKIPVEEMGVSTMKTALYFLDNLGEITMKGSKVCKNRVKGEVVIEIPEGHKNGLKYLFDLVENMRK
ncbi:hypothetical protein SAMN05216480_101228 [Pustulibacterium marinum]|uniref:DUF4836 family protein n=1 Tax=Pustulibacterium marinum TaxID=1224947 RepID=A0A1I7EUH6_9FLAO|nr:hypothetical protein [Pustulibacterium marinum]SFU27584.1 hypothetical protein SAMN05216480_101228 [Pustulibacterium marinum]